MTVLARASRKLLLWLSFSLQKKKLIADADGFICQHLALLKPE
jgi:hypothetical protein